MDFKNIPSKYRSIPFWSWNEKLDTVETVEQVHKMHDVGIGGFFMHARGGLETEYMGEEWFENVTSAVNAADECGMGAWAYDENGWPSGFGNGIVNGMGVSYQQKYLRITKDEPKENVIGKCGEHWFYYDINPFYVDTLDKKVVASFIETVYKPYYEKYGNSIEGFFTDEPQISRNGIPWSFVFDEEYIKRYGEKINEHLEELFLPCTEKLLCEFRQSGGKFVTADEIIENNVCDNPQITYTKREYDDFTVHYFVNTSKDIKSANISINGKKLDIYTGELHSFCGVHEFEPWGSLMVIEDGSMNCEKSDIKVDFIRPCGEFKIAKPIENAITLDRCDYYFDGELQEKNGYVLNICERANALEREVKIHQDYHVVMNYVPNQLFMVCETPKKFEIRVNGKVVDKSVCGYYIDKSFKKIDISDCIRKGENIISFDCDFVQCDKFYENRRNSFIFESEKNKLVYDMEIEAIYLLGDFTVKTDGEWTQLDKNAVRYSGTFEIDAPKTKLDIKNIEKQGYPFFCGQMELEGEIEVSGENPVLLFDRKGINAIKVQIGNTEKVLLTDNQLSIADCGVSGKTKIKLTLTNNLRNILGPHHLKEGECYDVRPSKFFKEPCVWNENPAEQWSDDYCFVETGI